MAHRMVPSQRQAPPCGMVQARSGAEAERHGSRGRARVGAWSEPDSVTVKSGTRAPNGFGRVLERCGPCGTSPWSLEPGDGPTGTDK
jgi:hypothetical protein